MAQEIGNQRAKAVKAAQARAEEAVKVAPPFWVVQEPYQDGRAWRCDLRLMEGERSVGRWFCNHNHKSPETAKACATREAVRRNKQGAWTEDKVRELVKEVTTG